MATRQGTVKPRMRWTQISCPIRCGGSIAFSESRPTRSAHRLQKEFDSLSLRVFDRAHSLQMVDPSNLPQGVSSVSSAKLPREGLWLGVKCETSNSPINQNMLHAHWIIYTQHGPARVRSSMGITTNS